MLTIDQFNQSSLWKIGLNKFIFIYIYILALLFNFVASQMLVLHIIFNLLFREPSFNICRMLHHWKKKCSHFDLKSWVTGGTKIRPGIPSNWKIFESNWPSIYNYDSILSQFDSQYRVNFTLNIESILLSISSQFDSQYRVNLTVKIESILLSISSQFESNIFQLLGITCRFLVHQWLNF